MNLKGVEPNGITYLSLPQLSSSFSILITYNIIFNDIASKLLKLTGNNISEEREFINFNKNEGILLVSHNIDLLQHVWNTTFSGEYLREYVPTYIVKAKQFKVFNFNNNSKNINFQDDGTLPWIGFYRAHKKELIGKFDKKVKYIIIDFIPTYHRKRAKQIIEWAKNKAEHVIVILPSNDPYLSYLASADAFKLPINQSTQKIINSIITYEPDYDDIHSWGTNNSLDVLKSFDISFNLNEYFSIDKNLLKILKKYEIEIELCRKSNGLYPEKIQKIDRLKVQMMNLIVPLKDYETAKRMSKQVNIFDAYKKIKQIPSLDEEEKSIEVLLSHHFYKVFEELYDLLYELSNSLRSELLLSVLKKYSSIKIIILIIDKFERNLFVNKLNKDNTNVIEILTYKEFHELQMKSQYVKADTIILTTPFPTKYFSAFNFFNVNIEFISILNDKTRYFKHVDNIYNNNNDIRIFVKSLNRIGVKHLDDIKTEKQISINVLNNYKFVIEGKAELLETKDINISIFDDVKLLELLKSNDNYELTTSDYISSLSNINYAYTTKAQLIEIEDLDENKKWIFIPVDDHLKIQRGNKDVIESLKVSNFELEDLWIRVNHDMKSDLFNEILKLASNTPLMKWINHGVGIWNEILESVWEKFNKGQRYKKNVYEDILKAINLNGGNIKNYVTIVNWFTHENIVRDQVNLRALIIISGKEEFMDSMRIVLSSVSKLRSMHIQLGRTISKLINSYSKQLLEYNVLEEWIRIGEDIVIPTEDIVSMISFSKITYINVEGIADIPNELLYKNLNKNFAIEVLNKYSFEEEEHEF
ncbi:hypothetical protein EXW93_12515 [Exiguobacterium sp. JMULE1]|nr:DrmE family protein [Exiguobacterium sp. JMULE1]NTY10419.1 hypothetical protein [Exiguobacterium sp. JMULE1]